jgi:hypothetical protein
MSFTERSVCFFTIRSAIWGEIRCALTSSTVMPRCSTAATAAPAPRSGRGGQVQDLALRSDANLHPDRSNNGSRPLADSDGPARGRRDCPCPMSRRSRKKEAPAAGGVLPGRSPQCLGGWGDNRGDIRDGRRMGRPSSTDSGRNDQQGRLERLCPFRPAIRSARPAHRPTN